MAKDIPEAATAFQSIGLPLGNAAVAGCWYDATSGPLIVVGVIVGLGDVVGVVVSVPVGLTVGDTVSDGVGVGVVVATCVAVVVGVGLGGQNSVQNAGPGESAEPGCAAPICSVPINPRATTSVTMVTIRERRCMR
jgi:hypothetical protein